MIAISFQCSEVDFHFNIAQKSEVNVVMKLKNVLCCRSSFAHFFGLDRTGNAIECVTATLPEEKRGENVRPQSPIFVLFVFSPFF